MTHYFFELLKGPARTSQNPVHQVASRDSATYLAIELAGSRLTRGAALFRKQIISYKKCSSSQSTALRDTGATVRLNSSLCCVILYKNTHFYINAVFLTK